MGMCAQPHVQLQHCILQQLCLVFVFLCKQDDDVMSVTDCAGFSIVFAGCGVAVRYGISRLKIKTTMESDLSIEWQEGSDFVGVLQVATFLSIFFVKS